MRDSVFPEDMRLLERLIHLYSFWEKTNQVRFFPKSERQPPQLRRLRKSDRLRSAQFIQRLVAFVGVAECASVEPF